MCWSFLSLEATTLGLAFGWLCSCLGLVSAVLIRGYKQSTHKFFFSVTFRPLNTVHLWRQTTLYSNFWHQYLGISLLCFFLTLLLFLILEQYLHSSYFLLCWLARSVWWTLPGPCHALLLLNWSFLFSLAVIADQTYHCDDLWDSPNCQC